MTAAKKILTYFVIAAIAVVAAFNYEIFVFPNSFAPAGLNGICTMIQHIWGVSLGYLSLIINIPLAIWVYLEISRPLAVRSMVYVAVFSMALLVLDKVDLSRFYYATENGTSAILGPLAAGVIWGGCNSLLVQCSAYSGGTDFIAAIIHKRRPETGIFFLIFLLNTAVALISYFVYDYRLEPVILCIFYSYLASSVTDRLNKNGRSAIRFEIVTECPDEIAADIIQKLHHTATLINGRGIYGGREKAVLICVVNRSQISTMNRIIRSHANTFAVISHVSEVMGNFKRLDSDGREERKYLDGGDGLAV